MITLLIIIVILVSVISLCICVCYYFVIRPMQKNIERVEAVYKETQQILLQSQKETTTLSQALRSSHQQGHWGELQLQRILELSGMLKHCDFEAQITFPTLTEKDRPDIVILLHDNRNVIIDAKAPLESYLAAMTTIGDQNQIANLKKYTQRIKEHIRALSKKEYWRHTTKSPEFVVLFLPTEAMFRAALEQDSTLFDYAIQYKIILASPMSLIALLKIIAFGWNQEKRSESVQQLLDCGQTIEQHLIELHQQWRKLRQNLSETIKTFNNIATTYSDTILPLIGELQSFGGTDDISADRIKSIHQQFKQIEFDMQNILD